MVKEAIPINTAGLVVFERCFMSDMPEITHLPYEDTFQGYRFLVESNPDRWRGGYLWAVYLDGCELDSGLCFEVSEAVNCAKACFMVNKC